MVSLLAQHRDTATGRPVGMSLVGVKSEVGATARMEAESLGHEDCALLLRQLEEATTAAEEHGGLSSLGKMFDFFSAMICARSPSAPAQEKQMASTDRQNASNRHLLYSIAAHLDDPRDLLNLAATSSLFHQLLHTTDEKEEEAGEEEHGSMVPWRSMFVRWYGQEEAKRKKAGGRTWRAVYGQGRPFYAVRSFMQGSWLDCFRERTLLEAADPFTKTNVDLFLRLHFASLGHLAKDGMKLVLPTRRTREFGPHSCVVCRSERLSQCTSVPYSLRERLV